VEGKNDDGENGAGNIILYYLKANNLNNVVIAVSRYYGGIKLGPDRFKDIKKALIEFFK
jgi:putative IMPACT (imprinted ancient) family translation regulator